MLLYNGMVFLLVEFREGKGRRVRGSVKGG